MFFSTKRARLGAKVSTTSGAKGSTTSGTKGSTTSGTKGSPTSGTKVSTTSGDMVSTTSGAKGSPTSGTKGSPTSGAKVSTTSPGSSGMGANFRKEDMNAIHRAASKNKLVKAALLLSFEFSDVYERDKQGRTALHVACAYGHAEMVRLLIKRPLLNLLDNEKKTALIYALQYQNLECAYVLIKRGANPNIMDNDGNTALHYAVRGHNTPIVQLLLWRKANIEARNKSDLTPLAVAKLENNEKMVEFLVSRGAKDDQSKQQLTSEEKGPHKYESRTPVADISNEDPLSSHEKITSEDKEEKGSQNSVSYTPVIELQKTQEEAWTKTNPMTVIDVSEEDSLSRNIKEPLTSGAMDSPTSGNKVSPASGAKVSSTSGTKVSPTSRAKVSPTSGAMDSPASGNKVSSTRGTNLSPTSGAEVSTTRGAKVSTTSGAKVSTSSGAMASPTNGAEVSPTSRTKGSPTSGTKVSTTSRAKVATTSGAKVSPTSGAKVSTTSGAMASPTSQAVASPTSQAVASPTSRAKGSPTSRAMDSPTSGAKVSTTSGTKVSTTSGAKVYTTSGTKVSTTSGAKGSPTSGAKVSTTSGAEVSPTSGAKGSPASRIKGSPTSRAMDSPTSGAKGSPTSGIKVSTTSGAKVSTTSGAKVYTTSGAKDSPTSGAEVSTTSGAKVSTTSGAKDSPTSGAKVSTTSGAKDSPTGGAEVSTTSGAEVSPTSGAKISHTSEEMVSPTSGTMVSHTCWTKIFCTSGNKVYPTSGNKVSPPSGVNVSPTSGAMVSPTTQTKVSHTSGAKVSHTSGAEVSHTTQTKVSHTSGAEVSPTTQTKVSHTSGAKVSHTSGAEVSPTTQTKVSHTSGAKVSHTNGAKVSHTSGAEVSPTTQTKVSHTSGAEVSPTTQTKVSHTSGAKVSHTNGAKVSHTSGAEVSPTTQTKVSHTSGAEVSHTRQTKVSHTSGAEVSHTSQTKVSHTSGAEVSHTSGAKVTPASRAKDSPTSQGNSGMEARRPNFRDKDMNAIHKAAKEGNRWKLKQILFFGISDLNARDKMSRTALHVACAYGRPRMVRLLIERQCLLDLSDIEKKTALIQALQYQNTKCATLLLDSGANPNIMDNDGNTALHFAVLTHNKAIVEKLLSCKANIEVRNKSDLTPLALAKLANNEKIVEFLVSRGAKDDQRKQKLTSAYEEDRRPRTPQWDNIVNKIFVQGSLYSKQRLTSKYKEGEKPPKSESSNLATVLHESPKSTQTKTKSKTVDEISAEGSLNSKQQLTSEYEEGRIQSLESSLFVEDISEKEDSLSSKQQLTSDYQERRRPHTSESTQRAADLQESSKSPQSKTKSKTVDEISAEDSLNSMQQLTSAYEEGRTQSLESSLFVEDISEKEDTLSSKQQLTSDYQERRGLHTSESTHRVGIDLRHTRKQAWTKTKSKTVDEISEKDSLSRLSSKSGIHDAWPTSHNEDFKDTVISKTCILTAKTSENQSKHIYLPPLHPEKMSQESQINRACDKNDTSAYSGHPSGQKDEEMCIKQGTLEQRKNLQLSKDESKQKSHEFSIKFKITDCPEAEPLPDNSKGGASLRRMPSNLTSKRLDCEEKDGFGKSVSAALQIFPEREEPTLKIVPQSHADPGSPEDSPWSSFSELCLREKELHSENDHKPDTEHVLNKNEESFHNDTENKKVRHTIVTSEMRKDQKFAMQMTKIMNPNTTDWKLGIGPTPQSSDPKSRFDLCHVHCNETKPMIELKSHDMPAVTNTYTKIKPNQDLFQKPLCADNCSANYCKSVGSKLKDESSSALHNDRTPGVYGNEKDLQRHKNDLDRVKVEDLAWKRKKIQLQKEVEEKKKQKSSKRKVSGTMYEGADDDRDSIRLSQQSNSEHTDNQQPSDKFNENTVIFMNKVEEKKKQKSSKRKVSRTMYEGADDNRDSIRLSQQNNSEHTDNQQPSDKFNENTVIFMNKVEEKKKQKTSKREVSRTMYEGADDDRDSIRLSQQSNSEHTDNQQPSDKFNENTVIFMNKVEEKKKQKTSKREVSRTMYEGADDDRDSIRLSQQSNSEHTDNQQPSDEFNENTVIFMNKFEEKKEQKTSKREVSRNMDDGADDSDSGGWSQQSNREKTDKQQVSIMEDETSDRFTLEEEKEERQKVDLLYEKNRVQLRKKEEHSIKEVEMNPYLGTNIRTRDVVSETARENEVVGERNYTQSQLSQAQNARILQDGILTKHLYKPKEIEITHEKMNYKVSESSDKEKSLLNENRMLWDEIAKLRLEIDTVKNQNQEMEKKYFEDIAIVKEKNDCLQKTVRKTAFQHNAQLEGLRAELVMVNSKLENEQQNRGRLEAEVESYRSRLASAVQDHEHSQKSKRYQQLAFQGARDKWLRLWDKMNMDMSNLKHNNEILSQQLSKMKSKSKNLEIELHHTRDALKERTFVLEKDLSQKQCQKEETEHVYQEEQGQVDKDIGKQESLQEKLSHLQTENKLLRQQLDHAHNKADREGKTVINIQDQIQDKISIFSAESVKQIIMMNERINELINEWHHFKERIHRYENNNVERDVIVRQLQEELAIVRQLEQKISMIEASLEVESRHLLLLQDKTHDLKKEPDQSRSQPQHEKEESNKYIDLDVFLQQWLQQVVNQKDDLEKEMTRLKELLKVIKKKINECDNEELSFPGESKPSPADIEEIQSKEQKQKNDELIEKLQPASSKCICLDEEKTPQQQVAMEALLKECEELKNTAEMWEQEAVNLRTHMETNMVESCEAEEYKKKIEERARRDVEDKLDQINSFLQTLRESQEMSEQMINNQASIRRPLELRNKDLESELSRVQTSRDDSKRELEKYMRLYQKQLERRKLLENKLTDFQRTKERLAEVSTELLLEEQQNRLLRSAPQMRPVLGAPCVGNLSNRFVPGRNSTPRENLDSPTSRSCSLTYHKMWREFEEILTSEVKEDAAKFETASYRAHHVASTYQSSSSEDLLLKAKREYREFLLKKYLI